MLCGTVRLSIPIQVASLREVALRIWKEWIDCVEDLMCVEKAQCVFVCFSCEDERVLFPVRRCNQYPRMKT